MISNKKLAVVMIVKNESAVIERCLTSILPIADMIVISDTGSTDDTLAVIDRFMQTDKALEIRRSVTTDEWLDFSHNRNVVLQHFMDLVGVDASDDWLVLSMDADDQLVLTPNEPLILEPADATSITVNYRLSHLEYRRVSLISNPRAWMWVGEVHEYLKYMLGAGQPAIPGELKGCYMQASASDGARSKDPDKYLKDAEVLAGALAKDPTNRRNQFYLARSYHDHFRVTREAGISSPSSLDVFYKALAAYKTRATEVPGQPELFEEERWYAEFMAAAMSGDLNALIAVVSQRPWRAEAALACSTLAEQQGQTGTALAYALLAVEVAKAHNNDILFVDTSSYGLKAYDRLGTIAYYAGFYALGLEACDKCLDSYKLSNSDYDRIVQNKKFYTDKLKEIGKTQ